MTPAAVAQEGGALHARVAGDTATLTLILSGRLDMSTTGSLWREARGILQGSHPIHVVIDASGVSYCDGAGVALIIKLRQHQTSTGGDLAIHGLQERFMRLLDTYGEPAIEPATGRRRASLSIIEQVGRAALQVWHDVKVLLEFAGELAMELLHAARHPRSIRWSDAWLTTEQAGVDGLPIIALVGFLLGLILAFEAGMAMRRFGAEIFVANLLGISMLRELGPLLTAIILAGRTGSAFAAELGTMKVGEEFDALITMGLQPVRFLVLPRVMAAVAMTPLLTVFANLFGLIGGAVVMQSMGFPLVTYINQIQSAVQMKDFLLGLFKSLVYGVVVAAIGCLRGLETTTGASAVGQSTTSAVVSGIILIAIVDGVFAVVVNALRL
ncbi:MlaE family lipid ABC transporter permease subunit [Nitrospira sp. Nam74]